MSRFTEKGKEAGKLAHAKGRSLSATALYQRMIAGKEPLWEEAAAIGFTDHEHLHFATRQFMDGFAHGWAEAQREAYRTFRF